MKSVAGTFDGQICLRRSTDQYRALLKNNSLLCNGLLSDADMEAGLLHWVRSIYIKYYSPCCSDFILSYFIDITLESLEYCDSTAEELIDRLLDSPRLSSETKETIRDILLEATMASV